MGTWARKTKQQSQGFTIVELLIVIVVIAILAAITVVAYNGIQQRARDAQRQSDIVTIKKALELYYTANNRYPAGSGSTSINGAWSTTADASWANLQTTLQPYISSLPKDPISKQMGAGIFPWNDSGGYDYSYYGFGGTECGYSSGTYQGYRIVYKLEVTADSNTSAGTCSTTITPYSSASNYWTVK